MSENGTSTTRKNTSKTVKISQTFSSHSNSNSKDPKNRFFLQKARWGSVSHRHTDPEVWYASEYDPLRMGSIDGTGDILHDKALLRASKHHFDPNLDATIKSDPKKTLFVGRIHLQTSQESVRQFFASYGPIAHIRLVRDIVTKVSKGYAFVEYHHRCDFERALEDAHHRLLDGRKLLVDYERSRLMPGWKPRRLGGGLGGRKESGQLRFGGREYPFKRPYFRAGRKGFLCIDSN